MSDWSLFLAIATFSLAGAAFWAIWQTHGIQKSEKAQRLLNEVIEWSIDIQKCPFEKDFRTIVGATGVNKLRLSVYEHIIAVKESYQAITARNPYIFEIARNFEGSLQKAVEELIKDLKEHIKLLDKWQHAIAANESIDMTAYADKADAHGRKLSYSTYKVIKQATKIKLKT